MCGIVGLYLKNPELEPQLGSLFKPMLIAMTDRGPDSAGFAIYGDEVPEGSIKLTLQHARVDFPWHELAAELEKTYGTAVGVLPFSGKDPTKVDRSAAYMARHIAKNIVTAGLADRCEVQLAYAIGVSEPISVYVDTEGTGRIEDARICDLIREVFPLTPSGIIKYLDLRRPIFKATAAGGHFGRSEPEFTWERTNKAAELADKAGVGAAAG